MATELAEQVLAQLAKYGEVHSLDLVGKIDNDHQKIIGAIKSLQTLSDIISVEQVNRKTWELTPEGQHIIDNGSHEAVVFGAIPDEGIAQNSAIENLPYGKVGLSKALQAGWIKLEKRDGVSFLKKNTESIKDTTRIHLSNLDEVPNDAKNEYKKRKLLREIIVKSVLVKKGVNFTTKIEKQETELTAELLSSGAWKDKKFKPYNFDALGSALDVGHLHPLLKVRTEFRKIFLEMGFTEMPTNNFVESSFWNFDALFQPQQHPARDAHDTFFVSEPRFSEKFPEDYLKKVKEVHAKGGYGSQGYRYDWKIEEAQKNLLRTHTTAVSARMLYKIMQEGDFKPVRFFSIDRVFRNETLDATHLAEFHQVEGVIADYNLTLGDLIGTLYEFFKKLGIDELEFKPAYNPYTEPSMEIFCFHKGLGKWIEIGNSGLFRPEMLLPMGIPENVNVIAWGLSLERPTMIKYNINNIRDLVGPKVDLRMVYDNPVCRLEKTGPRISLAKKMQRIIEMRAEKNWGATRERKMEKIVIFCNPNNPMHSLESLLRLSSKFLTTSVSLYTHSSVSKIRSELDDFCHEFIRNVANPDLKIQFIWTIDIGVNPVMNLSRMRSISGEVNIARYLNRLIEARNPGILRYESYGVVYATRIDRLLDEIHVILNSGVDKQNLSTVLQKCSKNRYFFDEISIVDVIFDSARRQNYMNSK